MSMVVAPHESSRDGRRTSTDFFYKSTKSCFGTRFPGKLPLRLLTMALRRTLSLSLDLLMVLGDDNEDESRCVFSVTFLCYSRMLFP